MNQRPGPGRAALVVIAVLGCLFTVPATAQLNPPANNPLVDDQLISLDADDTPVVTVLEILAERSGLNIVTSTDVQGKGISIHLRNTPFSEALNLVVRAAGMGYEIVGNSILVSTPERLATQTGLATRVFKLEYANAAEVMAALDVISEDIRSYTSGNRLILKAPQAVIEEVESIVKQVDQRPAQVMLEARLIEVNTSDLKELGLDWGKITNWTGILAEGGGVSRATTQTSGTTTTTTSQGNSAPPDQLPDELPFLRLGEGRRMYRQAEAFEVTVNFLLTDGNARLLANSKVTTMENQPAEIFIGQSVPVIISSLQSGGVQGGAFQSVQLEKIDVGVKLNIVPRVSSDGYITSFVEPEVSTIVAFVGPDNDLPQTSTRRARAVVRVRDGQKFYLGGLLSEEKRETIQKVPLLGDIPVLGYLFRNYRTETTQIDLLIEITPTIIPDQG